MSRLGAGRGAAITFLIAVGVMVQLTAVNKLLLKFSGQHLQIFVTAIVVVELQTIALVMWERRLIDAPVSYSEVIVSVAASVFLIFLSVGLYSFDLVSGEVARFANHGIEAERISSIARDQQIGAALRDMAQVLHGNVQTRLVSCAMALDLAAQANDGESANAALLEARRVLNAGSGLTVISAISLSDEIQRKVSVWSGLCACNVRIGQCSETPEVIDRVGRIVEEGIANAVRHGGATEIDIDIAPGANNSVDIRIADNGLGLQKGARGVGSAIIENASSGVWGLCAGDQGTVLAATVHR
jgi:signal transduction histidine kinase